MFIDKFFKRRSDKPKQMHGFLVDDEFNTKRYRDFLKRETSKKRSQ